MPRSPWEWDPAIRRYRDTRSGRLLALSRVRELRDAYADASQVRAQEIADRYLDGTLSLNGWVLAMRREVKQTWGVEYALGRGGVNAMTARDWGRLGYRMRIQYGYLNRFAGELEAGTVSPAQMKMRAALYVSGSVSAHERGLAAAWNLELPAYPGDGTSECISNDRCAWSLEAIEGGVNATWEAILDAHTCATCRWRSEEWNPYFVVTTTI